MVREEQDFDKAFVGTAPVSADNPELFARSEFNCRDEESGREAYTGLIYQFGMSWDVRGKVCTLGVDDPIPPTFVKCWRPAIA